MQNKSSIIVFSYYYPGNISQYGCFKQMGLYYSRFLFEVIDNSYVIGFPEYFGDMF